MFIKKLFVTIFRDGKEIALDKVDPLTLSDHSLCKLYIVDGCSINTPTMIAHFYPYADRCFYFQVKDLHNRPLERQYGVYCDSANPNTRYHLPDNARADHVVSVDIPRPKVRGNVVLTYRNGFWHKETKLGTVKLYDPEFYKTVSCC